MGLLINCDKSSLLWSCDKADLLTDCQSSSSSSQSSESSLSSEEDYHISYKACDSTGNNCHLLCLAPTGTPSRYREEDCPCYVAGWYSTHYQVGYGGTWTLWDGRGSVWGSTLTNPVSPVGTYNSGWVVSRVSDCLKNATHANLSYSVSYTCSHRGDVPPPSQSCGPDPCLSIPTGYSGTATLPIKTDTYHQNQNPFCTMQGLADNHSDYFGFQWYAEQGLTTVSYRVKSPFYSPGTQSVTINQCPAGSFSWSFTQTAACWWMENIGGGYTREHQWYSDAITTVVCSISGS